MDSSPAKHMGQAFTMMTHRRCRLSIVKIPPRIAVHLKAITLGGALILQRLAQLKLTTATLVIDRKKEVTENMPSAQAIQTLLRICHLGLYFKNSHRLS